VCVGRGESSEVVVCMGSGVSGDEGDVAGRGEVGKEGTTTSEVANPSSVGNWKLLLTMAVRGSCITSCGDRNWCFDFVSYKLKLVLCSVCNEISTVLLQSQ